MYLEAKPYLCHELECSLSSLVGVLIPDGKQLRREDGRDKETQEQESSDG